MSDELQKIAWASTSGGASGGQAREPVLWEDGLLLRILGHDGITAFDFPTLDLLGDLDGAASIGADDSSFSVIGGSTVQALLASIDAALSGIVVSGVILADGSVPFTGSQSLGGFDLTNVGTVQFGDGAELTANSFAFFFESDIIAHGNDGYNADGDLARFAAVSGEQDANQTGMLLEYGYGLRLSVFGSTGTGKMGIQTHDAIRIHEEGDDKDHPGDPAYPDFTGGEVGIMTEPQSGIALKVGGALKVAGDLYSGTGAWVDFSGSMDLHGFSATTTKIARYKMIGNLCYVQVHVIGTANGLTVNFDVPASLGSYEDKTFMGSVHCQNGSDYSMGCLFSYSAWDYQIDVQRTANPSDAWASGSSKFSANFIFRADSIPA